MLRAWCGLGGGTEARTCGVPCGVPSLCGRRGTVFLAVLEGLWGLLWLFEVVLEEEVLVLMLVLQLLLLLLPLLLPLLILRGVGTP